MLPTPTPGTYAAIFIDYENVYYFLKNHFLDPADLNDYVLDMIRNLQKTLIDKGIDSLIMNAYADFERLGSAPQGALYLMGVNTRNVLGTAHKNAADMQLCIDTLEVMYTRPEISTFVLMAGDRDYIPVLQHLRRQGRQVLVTGFRESVSGDLLQNIGADKFIEARALVNPQRLSQLEEQRKTKLQSTPATNGVAHVEPAPALAVAVARPVVKVARVTAATRAAAEVTAMTCRVTEEDERKTLALFMSTLQRYSEKGEVWLGPFMRYLVEEQPELSDFDRREMVNRLVAKNAITIEKREGNPHPFSVVIPNYNHPDVQALYPGDNH